MDNTNERGAGHADLSIPNGSYSAADILRLARALNVPGTLVSRGCRFETRAYPVKLANGEILQWQVRALPEQHHVAQAVRS